MGLRLTCHAVGLHAVIGQSGPEGSLGHYVLGVE